MDRRRFLREAAARRLLEERCIHGLPVGADPPELRVAMQAMDGVFRAVAADLLVERNPFFDRIRSEWRRLFPDLPAVPGRWSENRLFLYVTSSGRLFALRRRTAAIRARLAELEGAPGKFTVHWEIHAPVRGRQPDGRRP